MIILQNFCVLNAFQSPFCMSKIGEGRSASRPGVVKISETCLKWNVFSVDCRRMLEKMCSVVPVKCDGFLGYC